MWERGFHRLYVFLREFIHSYGVVLVFVLIVFNALFYLILPEDYLAFLFGEAVLVTLLWISESVKSIGSRIEAGRLVPVKELRRYYERQASRSLPFSEAYKILLEKTSPSGYQWVPGIVEKIFRGPVMLEPVAEGERRWVKLLEDLIKPYEDTYRNSFKSLGWNEFKVRPVSIKDEGRTTVIKVEPTTYYYSYVTNFSCDLSLGKGRTLRHLLEPLIVIGDPAKPLKTIDEARDLPISNHIGVNVLIITRDGDLLLSERSSFVAVEQGTIAHTVAGSLDWKTLVHLTSRKVRADLRELVQQEIAEKEEISFPEPQDYRIYPVALTRNLRLLGKPDLQLIGAINRTTKEILEHTTTGRSLESIKILRLKVSSKPIYTYGTSKCDLLKLVLEKLAVPLLKGREISCEYVALKSGRIETRPVKIIYDKLSTNLMIGLYAYLKAYQELCNHHG